MAFMSNISLNPAEYAARRIRETRPALSFRPPELSPDEWQVALRSRLKEALGGLDSWERVPLDAQITKAVELDGYRRETLTFATRPGLRTFGYFLTPTPNTQRPTPAVLCLPGHGRGVDSIVGMAEDGTQREIGENAEYQADFALQCVAQGWAVLALEQVSFGHRRGAVDSGDAGASSCQPDSMAAQMLGESMTGWRVWDAMRALDYLTTRPEVDSKRLMTMGISGGGLTSLFTAALDIRVWGAMVSGYLNTFADSILSIRHCVDNYAPNLLNVAEMPDIAGLIAPRLLFAESGREDTIFPIAAFERAVAQVTEIYAAFDAPPNFGHEIFDAGHQFHGVGAFEFLRERCSVL